MGFSSTPVRPQMKGRILSTSRLFSRIAAPHSLPRGGHLRVIRLPTRQPHKYSVSILDGCDVAIVILNHFHRCAHLLRQEVHVNTLRQPKGGVGVSETIGAPTAPRGACL